MSFNYIRTNFSKLGPDHLYKFLVDIVTRGQFDEIDDFDETRIYLKGAKIYMYEDGVHHIYECVEDVSTQGLFVPNEWVDIIDIFRGIDTNDIINKMYITEELFEAEDEVNEIEIQYEGYSENLCRVVLFHSIQGRLSETEFTIENGVIHLNDLFMNPGEYMIIDIYEYDNKVHPDLVVPSGIVVVSFIDMESNNEIRNPIVYKGDIGSIYEVLPAILNGYDFIEFEGELNGVYDIDAKNIVFKYIKK